MLSLSNIYVQYGNRILLDSVNFVLKPGERDVLKVKVIAGQNEYLGTTKNGITSQSYGAWSVSFVIGKPVSLRTDPAPEPAK